MSRVGQEFWSVYGAMEELRSRAGSHPNEMQIFTMIAFRNHEFIVTTRSVAEPVLREVVSDAQREVDQKLMDELYRFSVDVLSAGEGGSMAERRRLVRNEILKHRDILAMITAAADEVRKAIANLLVYERVSERP